jgi:hypothetical protein
MPRLRKPQNYGPLKRVEMPFRQKYQRVIAGSFSKVAETYVDGTLEAREWMFCREYFQEQSQGVRRILFCNKRNKTCNIAAFIDRIESKLKIQTRSKVGPTQRNNISWLWVSPWWSTTSMRRSLFTALLRAGQHYSPIKDNLEEALFGNVGQIRRYNEYTRQTEYAVRRFIQGYTKYTGHMRGWYNQFRWGGGSIYHPDRPTKEQVDKLLV